VWSVSGLGVDSYAMHVCIHVGMYAEPSGGSCSLFGMPKHNGVLCRVTGQFGSLGCRRANGRGRFVVLYRAAHVARRACVSRRLS
jgi:hypothetical protein